MADDTTQTYQLKINFSQYEKCYLTDHLTQYVQKIQRHLPKVILDIDAPFMLSDHRLLQFESTATSLIPAYDNFLLDVQFQTFIYSQILQFKPFPKCLLSPPPFTRS